MGLALSGLALSSMFGVNMLSGIKDYVDTTGNIMVDIADGIGMVSKGIEALEYYIDPAAEVPLDDPGKKSEEQSSGSGAGSAPPVVPGQPPGQPVAPVTLDQPAVFCQKGKCYPYDPSKVKGVNLEAKPGMIIQAAPTTSPKKVNPTAAPQKGQSVPQKGHKGQGPAGQKSRGKGDDDDDRGKSRQDRSSVAGSPSPIPTAPESNKVENSSATISNSTSSATNSTASVTGTKKVLSATRNLLERVSKLLVKFVHKIFPWNRRARRRVMGDGDDEEL